MGASSSCAIFERFSSALQFIAETKLGIKHMTHIPDDFLILGPKDSRKCQDDLDNFLGFCQKVGILIKTEKTVNATTDITFMGLELDSITMEARLPQDKLVKLRTLLATISKRRKVTLRELQSLLGLLNFCCQVVIPGRCFLRRLTDLTKNVVKPNHHITLNKDSRRDLQAWSLFAQYFNGKHLLSPKRWTDSDILQLHTDASGSIGYGAIFQTHWFQGTWPVSWERYDITFKELFPIALSMEVWGHLLKNRCIILNTDNEAVVYIINKQTCKSPDVMLLVRRLVLATMKFNILVRAVHIPGKYNIFPDLLSR
jgi:hypothetical protein